MTLVGLSPHWIKFCPGIFCLFIAACINPIVVIFSTNKHSLNIRGTPHVRQPFRFPIPVQKWLKFENQMRDSRCMWRRCACRVCSNFPLISTHCAPSSRIRLIVSFSLLAWLELATLPRDRSRTCSWNPVRLNESYSLRSPVYFGHGLTFPGSSYGHWCTSMSHGLD